VIVVGGERELKALYATRVPESTDHDHALAPIIKRHPVTNIDQFVAYMVYLLDVWPQLG
jgi:hypothetical protein